MKLENSFTVAAPLEDTWRTLLDIERVATCLPGAKIEAGEEEGVYRGAMKMKLGPMTVDYRGTARLQDVDEDTHTASIAVQAKEAKGQGTAAAVIRNHLESQNGKTRVVAETDLKITGRQAQFGRGIMEDVAGTMMSQFAERLERELQAPTAEAKGVTEARKPATEAAAPGGPPVEGEEALDVGRVLMQSGALRYAGIAGAVIVALFALIALLMGRRRQFTINIDLRR
jgi:carbon monoxide dehydrogenase subunit G